MSSDDDMDEDGEVDDDDAAALCDVVIDTLEGIGRDECSIGELMGALAARKWKRSKPTQTMIETCLEILEGENKVMYRESRVHFI